MGEDIKGVNGSFLDSLARADSDLEIIFSWSFFQIKYKIHTIFVLLKTFLIVVD